MKKRPVLLLEVLLSFLLLEICAIPLIKQPLKLHRQKIAYLEKMEKERLADWTFTEIQEMLFKNEIPWEKIPAKGKQSAEFSLPDAKIELPHCKTSSIKRHFVLKGKGEKVGMQGQIYRQLWIYLFLDGEKYSFRLPVQQSGI